MELRQLRYFVGVCDAGSLLRASRILHVAQPALGQHMASLEAELQVKLFARSSRGMALTENGRRFLEHVRVVLADVERARNSVQSAALELEGEVVVGLPNSVGLIATLPILMRVKDRFPKVFLRIVESHSGFLAEWLQAGRLDISVLFDVKSSAWLLQKPVLTERLVLVGSRQLKRQFGADIPLRKLADYPLLLPARGHGLREVLEQACAAQDVLLQTVAELDSLPNIKRAVEAGLGYTVLSPGAIADEVDDGRLESAALVSPEIVRTVVCATCLTRALTPAAAAVADQVFECLQSLVLEGIWPATLESA